MQSQPTGDDWIALSREPLSMERAAAWVTMASCGAVVSFAGTVRDHSEGRDGVFMLDYEAYEDQVEPRLRAIAEAARDRWPQVGRLVLWHRIGALKLEEASVIVASSSPHRPEAFSSARFLIDAIKTTVPIWKKETWPDGSEWSLCDHEIEEVTDSPSGKSDLSEEIARRSGLAHDEMSMERP